MPDKPTPSQGDASRFNGSLFHGPATAAGLARSSMNRLDSGVYSKQLVLPGESIDPFEAFLDVFVQEYDPTTPTEDVLVEELAIAKWRLDRVRTAQDRALADLDLSSAMDDEKLARKLNNFHRYESQYRRQFDRALKQLLELRAVAAQQQHQEAVKGERELKNHERFAKTMLAVERAGRVHAFMRYFNNAPLGTFLQIEPELSSESGRQNEPEGGAIADEQALAA